MNVNNKKYLYIIPAIAFFTILIISMFVFGVNPNTQILTTSQNSVDDNLQYHSNVCVYKNGELLECSHNLLYNNGKNMIRNLIGSSSGAIINMSLCNASAGCGSPAVDNSETYNLLAGCNFTSTQGTYSTLAGNGNWSIYKTYVSTCDSVVLNTTRLFNASGSLFAGNSFTTTTLNNGDTFTENWTAYVS